MLLSKEFKLYLYMYMWLQYSYIVHASSLRNFNTCSLEQVEFSLDMCKYTYIVVIYLSLTHLEYFHRPLVKSFLNNFLISQQNIHVCCGCSKELSQWDGTFEYPKTYVKTDWYDFFYNFKLKIVLFKPVFPHPCDCSNQL